MVGTIGTGLIAPTIDEQIAAELEKIRQATERIKELQRERESNTYGPFFPYPLPPPFAPPPGLPWSPLTPYNPYDQFKPYMPMAPGPLITCEVCKLSWQGSSAGYVCSRGDCPNNAVSCVTKDSQDS